jgi:hypothetical protein
MIYNILGRLFSRDIYDSRYTPKPLHLIYSVLLMLTGSIIFARDGYYLLGSIMFVFGILLGITIIAGMNWDKAIEYWNTINEHIKLMMKVNDPDIWQALGYKHAPQSIQIIETVDNGQGFTSTKINDFPVPASVMNIVSNKVLNSGKTTFSEAEYSSIIPNFRKIQKDWRKNGILKPNNTNNPRLGFSFSKKGMDIIYQYASNSIKLKEQK